MSASLENQRDPQKFEEDEVNLLAVFRALWHNKVIIIAATFIAIILSVIYVLIQPAIYKSYAILAPLEKNQNVQLSGIARELASFSGASLGGVGVSQTDITLETLKSRNFITKFIKKHKIIIPLMALKSWDAEKNSIAYDESIYDIDAKKWQTEKGSAPTDWEVFEKFESLLSVTTNSDTHLVTISFEFPYPKLAKDWITWLVNDINQHSKQKEIHDTKKEIQYLQAQLDNTTVLEIRNIFFKIIQEKIKTGLLAETRDEYSLTTIDPAFVPEEPIRPKRILIIMLGAILGAILGSLIVYLRYIIAGEKAN